MPGHIRGSVLMRLMEQPETITYELKVKNQYASEYRLEMGPHYIGNPSSALARYTEMKTMFPDREVEINSVQINRVSLSPEQLQRLAEGKILHLSISPL